MLGPSIVSILVDHFLYCHPLENHCVETGSYVCFCLHLFQGLVWDHHEEAVACVEVEVEVLGTGSHEAEEVHLGEMCAALVCIKYIPFVE
jgi:hypothetical protein